MPSCNVAHAMLSGRERVSFGLDKTYNPSVQPMLLELHLGPMRVTGQGRCIPKVLKTVSIRCFRMTRSSYRLLENATRKTATHMPMMKMCHKPSQPNLRGGQKPSDLRVEPHSHS